MLTRLIPFLLILSFASPLPGASPAEKAAEQAILLMGNGAEPEHLDPHLITGLPEFNIAWALFEGLTELAAETLDPIPAGANSWEVSSDTLTYTFHLRNDARWSDGSPVTARDYLFGWQRSLSPGLGNSYAYLFDCVENAQAFHEGSLTDFSQVGFEARDDLTLTIRLVYPAPHLLAMLAMPMWYPVHQESLLSHGAIDDRQGQWTRPGNLVSNGAFMLEDWQLDRFVKVRKNPYFHGAEAVRLEAIHFLPIESLQTEERSFRTGRLHVTHSLPPNKIEVYREDHPEALRIEPYFGTYFYRFNTTRPPLDDPRVRRALAMCIDRQDIIDHIARGGQRPASCLTPPGADGYTCEAAIPYDPEAARALLSDAGYPGGKGMPPVEILYNTLESHQAIAEAVQHMWRTELGVEATLVNQDWKVYLNTVKNLDYTIARGSWIGDYITPGNFLDLFLTGGGNNRAGFTNPAYDSLVQEAARTANRDARNALYQKAEALLLSETPIAPIYFYSRIYLKSPLLKGWTGNLMGYIRYTDLYFEP